MTMSRARWPGWTKQRTLLLPIPRAAWPPPEGPVTIDGVTLRPKRELHVTLVGNALGRALAGTDGVREAFEALDWTWRRTGRRSLLRAPPKVRGAPDRHAVVEHVAMPAMGRFHAALGDLLGRPLPVPPPHVTLFVAGTPKGIGLPDPATLARREVRAFGPDDPLFTGAA